MHGIARNFFTLAILYAIGGMTIGLSMAISHDHTKAMAPLGAAKLERVLRRFLRDPH